MKRFENESGVLGAFNNGTSNGGLDLLETMYLRLGKIVVWRVTVVKFGMYDGGCNDTGCFGIKKKDGCSEVDKCENSKI